MLKLVALGDVHYFRRLVPPWSLLGKRAIGQANVWFNRGGRFRRRLLPMVVVRVQELRPDFVLLTGDLVSTALPGEFADVMGTLRPLLETTPVAVVPGNHDRYTFVSAWTRRFERMVLQEFAIKNAEAWTGEGTFPQWVRLGERWRMLALDAAAPRTLNSRGRLGRRQLAAAQAVLAELRDDEGLIVLCHYPMLVPAGMRWHWQHRLADRAALAAPLRPVLERRRGRVQTLYVHGHVHRPWVHVYREGPAAGMVDVNAGAACMVGPGEPAGQGFCEIELPDDPRQAVVVRQHRPTGEAAGDEWRVQEQRVGPGAAAE